MATSGLGATIGSHSLRAIKIKKKGRGDSFVVQRVFADRVNDETRRVAGRALAARGMKGLPATVGLTGRDVIIRYSQIPPVPDWRLQTLMKFEVEEVSSQSGGDVSADYRKLNLPDPEGERDDDTVLVALARNRHVDTLIKSLDTGGLKYGSGVPNSVALFNAFAVNATYTDKETTLLVNIGADNLDMAIQQGGELIFARNATPAGQAFTEAIERAFSTPTNKAERMKMSKADVTPKGQAKYPDPASEKIANAIIGVAGQLASLIQSTLMIARAQTRTPGLTVDRVLLSGGGASLKGIDLYLKQAMGIDVDRFDPFDLCDLTQLSDEEQAMIEKAPHEFVIPLGLAQTDLSPAAFQLEVMPAALRRKRDFATKGIWVAAAGLVALGSLYVLYKKRSDASAEYAKKIKAIDREAGAAKREDKKMRNVLQAAQQESVKHRLLAEMTSPGSLLTNVLAEVKEGIEAVSPNIYVDDVRLEVSKKANIFPYYVPKSNAPASGYTRSSRNYYNTRTPSVRVTGRISGGQRPARLYEQFVQRCLANNRGLTVETYQRYKPGRSPNQDGTFKLDFKAGVTLLPPEKGGRIVTLSDLTLDDVNEPTAILGRRVDGTRESVPLDEIQEDQRNQLVAELKEKNKGDSTSPDK